MRLLALATALALVPATARADWLALHPECAFGPEARALGRMALLYPRPGLSAVVAAGEPLVARIRVPSGLTPPPGIQQERALDGWSAELVGQSATLGAETAHAYRLRVADVRPDGQSSLVYRATVHIPAWAAPGTYGLRMSAPGGTAGVAGAVRVIASGARPRIALTGGASHEPSERQDIAPAAIDARTLLESLVPLPFDVFVGPPDSDVLGALAAAPLDAPLPAFVALGPDGVPIALALGDALLTLGACDDRWARFDEQLDALERDHGAPSALAASALPSRGSLVAFGDDAAPLPLPSPGWLRIERDGTALRAIVAPGAWAAELTIRTADGGRAIDVSDAGAAFFPATLVGSPAARPSLAIRATVSPGTTAELTTGDPRALDIRLDVPARAVTTSTATLEVEADEPLALVAWALDEDTTSVGAASRHTWGAVGTHAIHVLAIAESGATARQAAQVEVVPPPTSGCDGCATTGRPLGVPAFWLLAAILVQTTRRRGNRHVPTPR